MKRHWVPVLLAVALVLIAAPDVGAGSCEACKGAEQDECTCAASCEHPANCLDCCDQQSRNSLLTAILEQRAIDGYIDVVFNWEGCLEDCSDATGPSWGRP